MKKRLLKDLPFGNLTKGTVLDEVNDSYQIESFPNYYSGLLSSENAMQVLEKSEREIVDEIWENEEWFEEASLDNIEFVNVDNGVLLRFKPISAYDKNILMKGLIHILEHLKDGSYTWNKFKDITCEIKNH